MTAATGQARGLGLRAWVERAAALPPEVRALTLRRLAEGVLRALHDDWPAWAHPGQLPPEIGSESAWRLWLIRAGRGFGKTRAGAEWVQA